MNGRRPCHGDLMTPMPSPMPHRLLLSPSIFTYVTVRAKNSLSHTGPNDAYFMFTYAHRCRPRSSFGNRAKSFLHEGNRGRAPRRRRRRQR